jgi:hypothetical protein
MFEQQERRRALSARDLSRKPVLQIPGWLIFD